GPLLPAARRTLPELRRGDLLALPAHRAAHRPGPGGVLPRLRFEPAGPHGRGLRLPDDRPRHDRRRSHDPARPDHLAGDRPGLPVPRRPGRPPAPALEPDAGAAVRRSPGWRSAAGDLWRLVARP